MPLDNPAQADTRVRLNLGAGDSEIPGFTPVDRRFGEEVYPLACEAGTVDEIRASHVLEHFPHGHVVDVVAHWVRALKPGGLLRLAVPDFRWICEQYLAGNTANILGYVMGGQTDQNDFHGCLFDADQLTQIMAHCGLTEIGPWTSEIDDCAALPVSLNLQGRKPLVEAPPEAAVVAAPAVAALPPAPALKVQAVMTLPRLGFNDMWSCAFGALLPHRIELRTTTGAFWGQCLTRAIEGALADGVDAVLTLDYDSAFTAETVGALVDLLARHPEADAIAPVQVGRQVDTALMSIRQADGTLRRTLDREAVAAPLLPLTTAHFGCTIIRASAFAKLPRPWFIGVPGPDGRWDDGKIDDDTHFWRQFAAAGLKLFQANRLAIGHCELMIRWPGPTLRAIHQHPVEFRENGPPAGVWK